MRDVISDLMSLESSVFIEKQWNEKEWKVQIGGWPHGIEVRNNNLEKAISIAIAKSLLKIKNA